jgi:WD40 repeat protein
MGARRQPTIIALLIGLAMGARPVCVPAADPAEPNIKSRHGDHYGDPLPPGTIARLGTLRLRHQGWITHMAFSPDGKVLATSGENGILARLWNSESGREIRRLSGTLDGKFELVKFSPNGRMLAGCSLSDGQSRDLVSLWDAATGKLLRRLPGRHSDKLFLHAGDLAFVDGEKTLVFADSDGVVHWWDTGTSKKIREWNAMQVVGMPASSGAWKFDHLYGTTLTPNGRAFAGVAVWKDEKAGKAQNQLIVWDLRQNKRLWHLVKSEDESFGFDVSVDGNIVAAIVGDGDVSIRDGPSGRELRRIKGHEDHNDHSHWERLALSPDGKMVAALGQGSGGVRVWDVGSGKTLHDLGKWIFRGIRSSKHHLVFSPDSKRLAFPWEDTAVLWDIDTWKERPRWQGLREPVAFLSFSADGKMLFSGTASHWPKWAFPQTSVTWDTSSWREIGRHDTAGGFPASGVQVVSRDHRLGILRTRDGDYHITDVASGNRIRKLEVRSPQVSSSGGFFSPSGRTVVQPVSELREDNEIVSWLAIVDVGSGKTRGSLPENMRRAFIAFAPDDQTLAWLDDDAVIHVVAVDGARELRTLGTPRDHWDHANTAPTMLFSPDGSHLAFWERDVNDVVVWNWRTGREYRRLAGRHPEIDGKRHINLGYAVCLAFSPDGRCLAVGSMASEPDIEVYELATGQVRQRISGHLGLIGAIAFSADGRLIASGSTDTTILVWDRYGPLNDAPASPAKGETLHTLWTELASADARVAGLAVAGLIRLPKQTPPFLAEHMEKVGPADPKRVAAAIARLGSNRFAERQQATKELEEMAELAEPALRKALADKPALETRQRIEALLRRVEHPPPDKARLIRAVEILEQLATPETRSLLQRLAAGAPGARLTREAKDTLERLAKRAAGS